MTDENLIRQIQQILDDLKAGDETTLGCLTAILVDLPSSNISGSTAVAIGSQVL